MWAILATFVNKKSKIDRKVRINAFYIGRFLSRNREKIACIYKEKNFKKVMVTTAYIYM